MYLIVFSTARNIMPSFVATLPARLLAGKVLHLLSSAFWRYLELFIWKKMSISSGRQVNSKSTDREADIAGAFI
jgi:hypothetical protein